MSAIVFPRLIMIITLTAVTGLTATVSAQESQSPQAVLPKAVLASEQTQTNVDGNADRDNEQTIKNQPDPSAEKVFQALMKSVADKDYQRFVSFGSKGFKNRISDIMFQGLAGEIGERMNKGYQATYLDVLEQGRYKTYLWKLTFADNGVEFLAKMTLDTGAVVGFTIN